MRNDTLHYSVSISSFNAASILQYATMYIITSGRSDVDIFKDLTYVGKNPLFVKKLGIAKDNHISQSLYIANDVGNVKTIIIFIIGKYTNSFSKKNQETNIVGSVDINTKKFGILSSPYDNQIRDFIKKQKGL